MKSNKDGSLDLTSLSHWETKRLIEGKRRRKFQKRVNMLSIQNHRTFWWFFLFIVWVIAFPLSVINGCLG